MDLGYDEATRAFREEVRDFLAANTDHFPTRSYDTAEGIRPTSAMGPGALRSRSVGAQLARQIRRARCHPLLQWILFEEEYFRAGAPGRASANGTSMLAPTLFAHGTDEQRDRILPTMASGEQIWAQAWSEPEAGSDLASCVPPRRPPTAAGCSTDRRSGAAERCSAIAPSGCSAPIPSAGRHRGLTYLMFDLRTEGVTVRPIEQLGGTTGFGEIFLDDVFVPDRDVIGGVHDGWRAAMSTTSNEAGNVAAQPGQIPRRHRATRACLEGRRCRPPPSLTGWPTRVKAQAYRLYTFGTATRLAEGGQLGAESSVTKVFWSELDVALHQTAVELRGPEAELADPWMEGLLFALGGPIYAGTNEIQRNIIAERILGLPASARSDEVRPRRAATRFAASLDAALGRADVPGVIRSWAGGDTGPGEGCGLCWPNWA